MNKLVLYLLKILTNQKQEKVNSEINSGQLPVLNNHKKWLKEFKEKLDDQKKGEEEEKQKQVDKLEKIKQEGVRQRESLRNSENTSIINQIETPKESVKLPPVEQSTRMKKGKKPVWAKTDQEIEQEQEK